MEVDLMALVLARVRERSNLAGPEGTNIAKFPGSHGLNTQTFLPEFSNE